jgi:hypothetical protein
MSAARAVVHAFAEAALVQIGRVKAGCGINIRLQGGAVGEMTADAGAKRAEASGAGRMLLQEVEHGTIVRIVGGDGLRGLQTIADIGAGLVIGQHGACGQVFMINLRQRDDKPMPGEEGGGAVDGAGDLKNLRVEKQSRIAACRRGAKHHCAHGTGGRFEFDEFRFAERHEGEDREALPGPVGAQAGLACISRC